MRLIGLYLFVLLLFGGMSVFDSINHAFNTLSTGGFSVKNSSIGYYQSSYIHWIITLFMFLGGVNFSLHFAFFKGRFSSYFKSEEFRIYFTLLFYFS